MREKTTLKSQGEGKGQKRKLAGAALTAALLLNPATSSAQDVKTVDQKQDKKEIVEKTPSVAKVDSTITWDEAVSGPNLEPNLEGGEISQEEIQEYIKNHEKEIKEEILKSIKEKKLDEETREIIYKLLTDNEEIKSIIEGMVNDKYVREAVLNGDKEYVQENLKSRLKDIFMTSTDKVLKGLGRYAILDIVLAIIAGFIRKSHGLKFLRSHSPWWSDNAVE